MNKYGVESDASSDSEQTGWRSFVLTLTLYLLHGVYKAAIYFLANCSFINRPSSRCQIDVAEWIEFALKTQLALCIIFIFPNGKGKYGQWHNYITIMTSIFYYPNWYNLTRAYNWAHTDQNLRGGHRKNILQNQY